MLNNDADADADADANGGLISGPGLHNEVLQSSAELVYFNASCAWQLTSQLLLGH